VDIAEGLLEYSRRLPLSGRIDGWGVFPNSKLQQALNALRPEEPAQEFSPPWTVASGNVERVVNEVRAEVGTSHPLHGVELSLRAVRLDTDDYLFETGSACFPLAVVRLTWQGSRSRTSECPTTTLYSSWRVGGSLHEAGSIERRWVPVGLLASTARIRAAVFVCTEPRVRVSQWRWRDASEMALDHDHRFGRHVARVGQILTAT
jgi:hypothetical protein